MFIGGGDGEEGLKNSEEGSLRGDVQFFNYLNVSY